MSLAELYVERQRILAQLYALRIFPDTPTVQKLRRELEEKLDELEDEIEELEREEEEQDGEEPEEDEVEGEDADEARSEGMKKYHRYIRLIHDNFPDIPYQRIRKEFSKRKRGRKSSIPDVVWQNPSP
jgi:predicted nuclease with TOPRIM domain